MKLDPFYPIVDSLAWVERLLDLGVRSLQLRAKDLDPTAAQQMVKDAVAMTKDTDARLFINDYWQAAIDAGARYVHLGQEDLAEADVPALRTAGIYLGISTHDPAELANALSHKPDCIALGPVYETTLKVMPWAPQGLDRVGEWKQRIAPLPMIAIGGISLERAPGVFAAGADSIAVVSDVVSHPDPDSRVRQWLAQYPNLEDH